MFSYASDMDRITMTVVKACYIYFFTSIEYLLLISCSPSCKHTIIGHAALNHPIFILEQQLSNKLQYSKTWHDNDSMSLFH